MSWLPAHGLDHVADAILVIDEPDEVERRLRCPPGAGGRTIERSWRRPAELAKGWPEAYLTPRAWKAAAARRSDPGARLGA